MNERSEFAEWRKSSYSSSEGQCVEVSLAAERAGVRDTKDRDGGALVVPSTSWRAFTAMLGDDQH
jgi:hypothetical protein